MTNRIIRNDEGFTFTRALSQPNQSQSLPLIRTSATFNTIMNQMRKDFQTLVQDKGTPISNVGIATNQKFLDILKLSRNSTDEIRLNAFLCPLYTSQGGISGDFDSFREVPLRAQRKMESYERLIEVVQRYIPIQVSFLLADRGISITDPNYPLDRLDTDIENMRVLFEGEIQSRIGSNTRVRTFSDIGVPIDRITPDTIPTQEDIEALFMRYGTSFSKFKNQYQVLTQSFGPGGAYSICRDYLAESRYTAENDTDSIYLNVESCSPMNTLYQIGEVGKRLIDTNLYIGASYRA